MSGLTGCRIVQWRGVNSDQANDYIVLAIPYHDRIAIDDAGHREGAMVER
jgi:hypothetical protein